ncbi:hypothetical protein [Paracoccus aminophilus]|uniref:Uncharacterized protein n=1 Tax=Paracoccus aminophilus JCM 7686 TaxID=1367847 RepID=S5Y6K7_PARAH|nr:hypothetical protein [Paracoccus aminophilus]AGT11240.1 hypothetical protein JCM7686_pAMI5p174 [Paracoccus aminophilus JCM 7686]
MTEPTHFAIHFDRPEDEPDSGRVNVGWFLMNDKRAVLFDPPERVAIRDTSKKHAKSASRCPAVIQLESRYFMVRCPYDLNIGFTRDSEGRAALVNREGVASPVRANKLSQILTMVNEAEWRYPDRPTIQVTLPYCFIADETVYVSQIAPFLHYRPDPLPGTIFGGRFPINVWPRPLMWAFEWHDPRKDIVLRRGEPLFYVQFEANDPSRPINLFEADRTPELETYMEGLHDVVSMVNQTFSLFKSAEARRPKSLLSAKKRD